MILYRAAAESEMMHAGAYFFAVMEEFVKKTEKNQGEGKKGGGLPYPKPHKTKTHFPAPAGKAAGNRRRKLVLAKKASGGESLLERIGEFCGIQVEFSSTGDVVKSD